MEEKTVTCDGDSQQQEGSLSLLNIDIVNICTKIVLSNHNLYLFFRETNQNLANIFPCQKMNCERLVNNFLQTNRKFQLIIMEVMEII